MMGFDQVRASGGEVISPKSKSKKKPAEEDFSQPEIFQAEDKKFQVKVPDGWRARKG